MTMTMTMTMMMMIIIIMMTMMLIDAFLHVLIDFFHGAFSCFNRFSHAHRAASHEA
jgi:hypothetical protein